MVLRRKPPSNFSGTLDLLSYQRPGTRLAYPQWERPSRTSAVGAT
jgi:hypothetical protein